jgi:hypothetical protein
VRTDTHATPQPVGGSRQVSSSRLLDQEEYCFKGEKTVKFGKRGGQLHKFIPSCKIRDLKPNAKHDTGPIRTADWQRAKKIFSPTHLEINSRHM